MHIAQNRMAITDKFMEDLKCGVLFHTFVTKLRFINVMCIPSFYAGLKKNIAHFIATLFTTLMKDHFSVYQFMIQKRCLYQVLNLLDNHFEFA